MAASTAQLLGSPPFLPVAGAALVANNVVQIGPDNLAYPLVVTDFGAAGPNNPLFSPASLLYLSVTAASVGSLVTSGLDGTVYKATANTTASASQGLVILRFSTAGVQIGKVVVDTTTAAWTSVTLLILTNGNIAVVGLQGSAIKYAIFTPQLSNTPVVAITTVSAGSQGPKAIKLSGGGFAVIAPSATTTLTLTAYNNAGVSQGTAAMTISSTVYPNGIAQLSNGNIAVAYFSAAAAISFNIFTSVAGAVAGPTSAALGSALTPSFCAVTAPAGGGFAIAGQTTGAFPTASVWNNAGAQQGSTFVSTIKCNNPGAIQLTNDGVNSWVSFIGDNSARVPYGANYVSLTAAGVAAPYTASTVLSSNFLALQSVFDGCGNIVSVAGDITDSSCAYFAFNVNLATTVVASVYGYTVNWVGPTNGGNFFNACSVASLSDGVVAFYGNASTSTADYFAIQKVVNLGIAGTVLPSSANIAAGSAVSIDPSTGGKLTTALLGSAGVTFASTFCSGTIGPKAIYQRAPGTSKKAVGIIATIGATTTILYTPAVNSTIYLAGIGTAQINSTTVLVAPLTTSGQVSFPALAGVLITISTSGSSTLLVSAAEL